MLGREEVKIDVPGKLPESTGSQKEIDAYLHEWTQVREAFTKDGPYEFEANLPGIVGYIAPEDQEKFSTVPPPFELNFDGQAEFSLRDPNFKKWFLESMPSVNREIQKDLEKFGNEFELDRLVFERKITEAGSTPMPASHPHIDVITAEDLSHPFIQYIVSDKYSTESSAGPAIVEKNVSGDLQLRVSSFRPETKGIPATNFSIVRFSPLTIHNSPFFPETAERTRLQILARKK